MKDSNNANLMRPGLVIRIEVEKLFGRYNYKFEIPSPESGPISKMAILYGSNGTGKTTILKLLFHLISPRENRGHRSYISRIPFTRFTVVFSDETKIEVVRANPNPAGPYTIKLTRPGQTIIEGKITPEPDGGVKASGTSLQAEKITAELAKFGLSIFFLGDDRILQSDQFGEDIEELHYFETRYLDDMNFHRIRERQVPSKATDRRDFALRQSLERTETWLRRRSILASTRGETEAQQIYANIVETINKAGLPPADAYKAEKETLTEELKKIDERSSSYERFGLIPRIDASRFIGSLSDTEQEVFPFVSQVVRSFVDGQKARLDSLDELYNLLNRFLVLINGFLQDKYICMEAREGISILVDSGDPLDPENLSSGEKQLLLLLFNVLTASETASLFLIDEPEISLNIKWQRNLVDSLIDITGNSNCQFLLATHSIELLTKHKSQTIKLNTF